MTASYKQLLEALRETLPPERLIDDPLRTLAYGTDASFYRLIPKLIVRPESEDELMAVLAACRTRRLPVTFRAAGTSLSGQAITDSVLIQMGQGWRGHEILEGGQAIRLQPGVIGARANQVLAPFGRKIGPDPASIGSCMIGGIAANNASGMCCGTAQNSYRTVRDIRVILADGTRLDTADPASCEAFRRSHAELVEGLERLSADTRANTPLAEKIRHKYRLKNTTGYALNSLVDFTDGIEILKHLMIGSEGTLGFISTITFDTVVDEPLKAAALLFLPDMATTCRATIALKSAPVSAVELMDRAALRSVERKPGMPEVLKTLPDSAAALLIDVRGNDEGELEAHGGELRAHDVVSRRGHELEVAVQRVAVRASDLTARGLELGVGEGGQARRVPADGDDHEVAEVGDELAGEPRQVRAKGDDLVEGGEGRVDVAVDDRAADHEEQAPISRAEDLCGDGAGDGGAGEGDDLVEQAQGVAHAAGGLPCDEREGVVVDVELLRGGDVAESADDIGVVDASEVEALDAAQDGDGDLLRVRRGEDEDDVRRWLFEGLEEGVEGLRGEHVDFVDDVDLESVSRGRVLDGVADFADLVDAAVGGAVELEDVDVAPFLDLAAGAALPAGLVGGPVLAVEGHGEDARAGGLADAAGAGEEDGVRHASGVDRVAHGPRDVFLSRQIVEGLRAPFSGEDDVGHRRISAGGGDEGAGPHTRRTATVAPFRAWRIHGRTSRGPA